MKLIFRLFLGLLTIFSLVSGRAYAVPVIYTFDGTITGLSDFAGLGAAAGYTAVGQAISYSFLIDTALPGTQTFLGVTSTASCGADSCYFADYLSGGVTGSGSAPFNYTGLNHSNVESNFASASGAQGLIVINRLNDYGIGYDHFEISALNYGTPDVSTITHWQTGVTSFLGFNQAWHYGYGSTGGIVGANTEIWTQLTLTSINPLNPGPISPVPEPETYVMLLAGLGLIGFTARRRKDLNV
jgi:hypothetical protein